MPAFLHGWCREPADTGEGPRQKALVRDVMNAEPPAEAHWRVELAVVQVSVPQSSRSKLLKSSPEQLASH